VRALESPNQSRPETAPCKVLIVDDDTLVMTGTRDDSDLGHSRSRRISAAERSTFWTPVSNRRGVDRPCHAIMTGLQLAGCIQEKFPGLPIIWRGLRLDRRVPQVEIIAAVPVMTSVSSSTMSTLQGAVSGLL